MVTSIFSFTHYSNASFLWVVKSRYFVVKDKPFPKQEVLDFSKLREFADDNFEFNEIGRKFFKLVENTGGKGEIARYEQFLIFPPVFT